MREKVNNMGKKLITPQNAVEYICGDKFYVGKDMILSSSAKDYFKEKMITLVYGEEKASKSYCTSFSYVLWLQEDKVSTLQPPVYKQ